MDPPEPIEAISAITLLTAAMPAAVAFYAALGFEVVVGGRDEEFTTFRAGGSAAVPNFVNLQLDPTHDPTGPIWGRSSSGSTTSMPCTRGRSPRGSPRAPLPPTRRGASATSTSATPTATSSASHDPSDPE